MIVAVIDSAQVSELSPQEVWEAGLEIGPPPPHRPADSVCPAAPGCCCVHFTSGVGGSAGKKSSPSGVPLLRILWALLSPRESGGIVFALSRPSAYLTQDETVTPFLSGLSATHTSPRGFSFADVHSQAWTGPRFCSSSPCTEEEVNTPESFLCSAFPNL